MNSIEEREEALKRALEFEEEEKCKLDSFEELRKQRLREHPLYKQALGFFQSPQGKATVKRARISNRV